MGNSHFKLVKSSVNHVLVNLCIKNVNIVNMFNIINNNIMNLHCHKIIIVIN